MITLQQLRVLLAIREHGSLTRAADALHYGVPTVTHHVRTLEAHLETQLVDRDRTGAKLTAIGEFFADEVSPVFTRIDRAEHSVRELRDAGTVTLRIASFPSIGSRLLPAAISALHQRGNVRVEVVEAEPTEVVRLVRAGEVHAGLIYHLSTEPGFVGTDLVQRSLFSEPYRVLVAGSSDLAQQDVIDFAALADTAWLCSRSDDEASDRVLRRVYQSLGLPMRVLMQTDDLYMIHGLVAEGLGCALTTDAAVDADFDVVLRPAVQDLGERNVSFVTRRGPQPAAVGWLEEVFASSELPAGQSGFRKRAAARDAAALDV